MGYDRSFHVADAMQLLISQMLFFIQTNDLMLRVSRNSNCRDSFGRLKSNREIFLTANEFDVTANKLPKRSVEMDVGISFLHNYDE